ncbi:MAG TPA: anti-sigma factor [Chryseolinea sp.]|nr:anti-sigma factor [Chryseolinea sp.]HPH46809.1 anti-sigma factor [Chryseolinea sp.]HPM30800.1 anti-sigma factor [Chryseolinea sp.]
MNVAEYISSGILEAYALGELTEQDRVVVENNLAQYPELRTELLRVEEVQEALLMQAAIAPRKALKENLFQKIEAQKPETKVVSLQADQSNSNFWRFAVAASVTIALIASYLAYDYRDKWMNSEGQLTQLIAQNQRVAEDYNQVNQRLDKIESDLKVVDNPDFKRVVMKGTEGSPESMAYVYWNESSKEVYLSIQNMRELSKENQYQLWAIIDGKPVDAGVFDNNLAGLLKMKAIGNGAAAFAVTIEPRGGKASPTLETMQVVGNVVKG